jgi:hypothetical protein
MDLVLSYSNNDQSNLGDATNKAGDEIAGLNL